MKTIEALPLFPLKLVLLPGAQLGLKVFEARYLDLMAQCMRSGEPFGVICIKQGNEVGTAAVSASHGEVLTLETVGTLAHIDEVDAEQPGILRVRCHGGQRFRRSANAAQQANGLWVAPAELLAPDPPRAPGPAVQATVDALDEAIQKLKAQDQEPFDEPYRLDDAGWIANRWCELLPIALAAKQKLMELDDPVIRLSLVDAYLRDKHILMG